MCKILYYNKVLFFDTIDKMYEFDLSDEIQRVKNNISKDCLYVIKNHHYLIMLVHGIWTNCTKILENVFQVIL